VLVLPILTILTNSDFVDVLLGFN